MRPDISIIIPVFNAQDTLKTSIKSIINQKYKYIKPKIEIILSLDDNKEYEELTKINNENVKIKIVKTNKQASGPGNARNQGIKISRGKYIGFLDADDSYSSHYIEEMLDLVKKNGIAIAPTHVFKNHKRLMVFKGNKNNMLTINDISDNPCSYHPMINRKKIKYFEDKPSQDIYNLSKILNKRSVSIIKHGYYILNIKQNSLTRKKNFYHNINLAYKFYQIKSLKEKKLKIARQFAIRRILNRKYLIWSRGNENKSYYEFIQGLENEKKKYLCI